MHEKNKGRDSESGIGGHQFSLLRPPPIPQVAFLSQLRIALNKYRNRHKIGYLYFAKNCLFTLVSPEQLEALHGSEILDVGYVHRKLTYWAGKENGRLNDPRLAFLVELFFREKHPEYLVSINTLEKITQAGDAMSAFVSVPARVREFQALEMQYKGLSGATSGLYWGYTHYRKIDKENHLNSPDCFILLTEVAGYDFFQANRFRYIEKNVDPRRFIYREAGFYFPWSARRLMLTRRVDDWNATAREMVNWGDNDGYWAVPDIILGNTYAFTTVPSSLSWSREGNHGIAMSVQHFIKRDHKEIDLMMNLTWDI